MDNNNDNNDKSKETNEVESSVNSTPQNSEPQVVEVTNTKEVEEKPSNVENNNNNDTTNVVPTSVELETNTTGKKKKGSSIFLILLMVILFAFVFFLPEITAYITDYMNQKSGVTDLKSGTMSCTFSNSTENVNYSYDFTFTYTENKLKSSSMTTTSRLTDSATDTSILTEKESSCEFLRTVLEENDIGMSASCSVSATVQITTQDIDYEELDMDFITNNITEFEGFYPEYELDESITIIENELENLGYTCERNEK